MDQTHIHLIITHLPIFGSILGGFVLAHGIWTKSNQTKIAAYNLFIISSIGAGIAYLTGEAAEETVENLQGVVETTIGQHEDFALFALISLIVLGLSSILGLYLTLKESLLTRKIAFIILLVSIISFGLVARTGYLGGQIRHTEINSSTNGNPTQMEKGGDED
ncbi:MAG: hypothetical protein IPO78_12055 [Saprospiraceae bacterium]|nr:hypothetical protein [Saprospiraceae bacterium]MBK9220825.1 hypothetical protein [Saprospiraceae bacterium]MBK9722330.1 hypothetical protein [Saprospiraceae bacterium]